MEVEEEIQGRLSACYQYPPCRGPPARVGYEPQQILGEPRRLGQV